MSTGGAGINTSAVNTAVQSAKTPYAPAQQDIQNILSNLGQMQGTGGYNTQPETNAFSQALSNLNGMPNFGPAAAQTASNFLQTGGDPTGLLRTSAGNLQSVAGEGANGGAGLNPMNTPGMQNVLNTIQNDTQNSVNGQFAGAGRSLSGLNEQTLARGLAQGEAVPLLNQYNQNVSNMEGANTQLGNISQNAAANLGQGLNIAQAAPGLATSVPMAAEGIAQQQQQLPYQTLGEETNIANILGGLGGQTIGTGNTQNTGSLLSALTSLFGGSGGGIAGGASGLLSSLFGGS